MTITCCVRVRTIICYSCMFNVMHAHKSLCVRIPTHDMQANTICSIVRVWIAFDINEWPDDSCSINSVVLVRVWSSNMHAWHISVSFHCFEFDISDSIQFVQHMIEKSSEKMSPHICIVIQKTKNPYCTPRARSPIVSRHPSSGHTMNDHFHHHIHSTEAICDAVMLLLFLFFALKFNDCRVFYPIGTLRVRKRKLDKHCWPLFSVGWCVGVVAPEI